MIGRIVVAIAVGVLTALVILLIGLVCVAVDVPILKTVGKFLEQWCWVFGVIAAVLSFFGRFNPINR